jgi:hypothetical protein
MICLSLGCDAALDKDEIVLHYTFSESFADA